MSGERRPMYRNHRDERPRDANRPRRLSPERENDVKYDAECTQCHEAFQVPFQPAPDRPILCRSCLKQSRESSSDRMSERREPHGDRPRDCEPRRGREYSQNREPRRDRGYSRDRDYPQDREFRRDVREPRQEPELFEITCTHCGKPDTVPFKPYEGSVVLCRDCMNNPNVERVGGKIYHTIICSVCGKENRVPFKPDPGSRVLCRDCHAREREDKQRSREYYQKHHPSVVHNTRVRVEVRCEKCGKHDTLPFVPKTDGLILCRQCAENTFGDEWARRNRVGSHEYPFTCARCAAQDFVPFKPKPDKELLCRHCLDDQAVLNHSRDEMTRHDAFTCVRRKSRKEEN